MENIIEKLKQYYGTYREMAYRLGITEATIHNVKNGGGSHVMKEYLRLSYEKLIKEQKNKR